VPQKTFDDPDVRTAMTAFVRAADALDEASSVGGEARDLLDLAETKAMAGMALRRRLEELGWTAPAVQRSAT
jgi:hypothetical protein